MHFCIRLLNTHRKSKKIGVFCYSVYGPWESVKIRKIDNQADSGWCCRRCPGDQLKSIRKNLCSIASASAHKCQITIPCLCLVQRVDNEMKHWVFRTKKEPKSTKTNVVVIELCVEIWRWHWWQCAAKYVSVSNKDSNSFHVQIEKVDWHHGRRGKLGEWIWAANKKGFWSKLDFSPTHLGLLWKGFHCIWRCCHAEGTSRYISGIYTIGVLCRSLFLLLIRKMVSISGCQRR